MFRQLRFRTVCLRARRFDWGCDLARDLKDRSSFLRGHAKSEEVYDMRGAARTLDAVP